MQLSPGTHLTDKVRLVEPIADGGMGEIWRAEHLTLGIPVAVKLLAEDRFREDEVARARFEREAAISTRVRSPHVVRTFDAGIGPGGRPYIVMELLEGESLAERVRREPLSVDETALVLEQVGDALAAAHAQRIVHRDVKPANVFLTPRADGFFCKLLDFGIAKERRVAGIEGLTEAGTIIGTLEFMSPEQLMKPKDADPSADLWALAVTAYAALTAELPFEGDSLGELCVKVLNAEVEPPSRHRPDLPPAVDRWFERALHPKCEGRFAEPEEMATSFREAAMGRPVEAPHLDTSDPVEVPALPQRESSGRQLWPISLGVAAVVFVGAGAWWLRATPSSPSTAPLAETTTAEATDASTPPAASSATPAPEPLAPPARSGETSETIPSSRAPAGNTPRPSLARTPDNRPASPPSPPTTATSEPKVEDRGAPDNPGF